MRVAMAKFDPLMNAFWGVYMSRFVDVEKINICKENSLKPWEAMCKAAGDKWLLGTDEMTMLDVHCGAMWDSIYTHAINEGVYKTFHDVLDAKNFAPHWCAYMERFRAHPAIHKYRFRNMAVEKHGLRARDWPQGEKCQLSLAVLEGVFEAEQ
jgi:glutathione S-transferase